MKSKIVSLSKNRDYIPFLELKALVKSKGIKSSREWFKYWEENKRPLNISANPDI